MILLIGGCGFLGRSLADHLYSRGYALKIFDRPEAIAKREREAPGPIYHPGDFVRIDHDDALFEGVTVIIHLVHSTIPATSMSDIAYDAESNILPAIRLLEIARHYGIKRFLFVSSGGTVYGDPRRLPVTEDDPTTPLSAYGVSKLAIEKYVQLYSYAYGLEGIVVRLANPYGRHQLVGTPVGAISNFLLRVMQGVPIEIWGDGSTVRDYIHIDDAINAIESFLVKTDVPAGIYNLSSGIGYSLHDVLNVIHEVTKRKPVVEYRPVRTIDVPAIVLDITRIEQTLNWQPRVTLKEGIKRLWHELDRDNL